MKYHLFVPSSRGTMVIVTRNFRTTNCSRKMAMRTVDSRIRDCLLWCRFQTLEKVLRGIKMRSQGNPLLNLELGIPAIKSYGTRITMRGKPRLRLLNTTELSRIRFYQKIIAHNIYMNFVIEANYSIEYQSNGYRAGAIFYVDRPSL